MPILSHLQIEEFIQKGFLVVDDILTEDEIVEARIGFHKSLMLHGVDVDNLEETAINLNKLSTTNGSGGVVNIFYPSWRIKIIENEKLISTIEELYSHTYASSTHPLFSHPLGAFDPTKSFFMLDRCCFRIPDKIGTLHSKRGLQRSLSPHLDSCPYSYYENFVNPQEGKDPEPWRPIQCSVSLVDTLFNDHGGFECVEGFHHHFDSYFNGKVMEETGAVEKKEIVDKIEDYMPFSKPGVCLGKFTALRSNEDASVIKKISHVPCKKGSAIFWDNRIPHANSKFHKGDQPREVIYAGFLPNVKTNKLYVKKQLENFKNGIMPGNVWHKSKNLNLRETPEEHTFSEKGKMMMGFEDF